MIEHLKNDFDDFFLRYLLATFYNIENNNMYY